jgi:hypothetical protein
MFGDDDFSAGFGIATFPQIFTNRRKIPEVYEGYAFASMQRGFDDFERCLGELAASSLLRPFFSQTRLTISALVSVAIKIILISNGTT